MKRWLFGDYKIKLLALILGVLLWFYAKGEVVLTEVVSARLMVEVASADIIPQVVGGAETITLEIKGRKSEVERLQQAGLSVVVSADMAPGEDKRSVPVALTEDMVRGILGTIDVLSFKPAEITLKLVRKGGEPKPVEANIVGSPAAGYEIGEPYVWPETVRVEGPKTLLENIDTVKTQPINVFQRRESFEDYFAIDPRVEGGKISCKEKVYVWVSIGRATTTEVIEGIPVHISYNYLAGFKYDVSLEETTVSVTLRGPKDKLEELKKNPAKKYPEGIYAHVDVSDLGPAGVPQPQEIEFILPEGVSLADESEKPKVAVWIKERKPEETGG